MAVPFVFHRPDLARRLADDALGLSPFGDASGLFLAAPRRTGKSTFLGLDLVPEIKARGAIAIHVDLWSDRSRDPADVVMKAIGHALRDAEGGLAKAARRIGLSRVPFGDRVPIDAALLDRRGGATVTDAIGELHRRTDRPIVLVIDEAQHVMTTDRGTNATYSLKSARDTLNVDAPVTPFGNVRLGLVMMGSNRDRLAAMVTDHRQAFYGSRVTAFPLLGREYAEAYARHVNAGLAAPARLDPAEVATAFDIVGQRPQFLETAVSAHVLGGPGPGLAPSTLAERALSARGTFWSELDAVWEALTDVQRAVVARLASEGEDFRPFDAAALAAYSAGVGREVAATDAQAALERLRDEGMVVRLGPYRYGPDDTSLPDWFATRFPTETASPSP